MKRGWKILIAGCAVLVVGLAALFASGGPGRLAGASDGEYDLSGMIRLVFSDIDTVCGDPNLAQSGGELLKQMENEILISLIVDSQIVISPEELGEYSCLVLTDPAWVARFGDPGKLRAVELESVSQEMQEFLSAQMPLWTADGSVLPERVGLYEYIGDSLLALPFMAGIADHAQEVKNPLLILIENPATVMDPSGLLLPMASSGNLVFSGRDKLERALTGSAVASYAAGIEEFQLQP